MSELATDKFGQTVYEALPAGMPVLEMQPADE
jgi:hypothetical protein